ncbi:MAG: hypothetical protein ACRDNW_09290, partial [Trebonia sp.]
MHEDPYADPVTGVPRNKLGLGTAAALEAAEREITHAAMILLRESPVRATYDLAHLCAIHRRIFGDIYDWAGQIRTVAIAKGSMFCLPQFIEQAMTGISGQLPPPPQTGHGGQGGHVAVPSERSWMIGYA